MRTITRLALAVSILAAALGGWQLGSAEAAPSVEIRPGLLFFEAAPEQIQMGRWAARRFEKAELQVPEMEVHFHEDLSGCGGNLGYAKGGRIDLCMPVVDTPARRALLHEMGHIWLDENVELAVRTSFLELRGLTSWNASNDPWNLRGYEHGAEVLAWALGERILTPSIPDNEPTKLARGFELLTGSPPPAYTDAGIERTPSTHKGVVRTPRTAPG